MKKQDYWQFIRTQRGHEGHKQYERKCKQGVIVVNDVGLASYAYDYWKQNGVLPEDYLAIPEKGEEGGDVLRQMWEFAERDSTFQTAVLDAFEKHYITPNKEKEAWYWIRNTDVAPLHSTVEAPQLRRIIQKALLATEGINTDDKSLPCTGLMNLCVEHCRLKHRAIEYGACAQALFNNADVLSLITEDASVAKDIETVLEAFEKTRKELGTRIDSPAKEDLVCFNLDIRPILLGNLMKEARTFGAWQKVFTFSQDRDTKIYALYHMSDMAKSLSQVVAQYRSAKSIDFKSVVQAFKNVWKGMCSKMDPEDLLKMSSDLQLDHKFIEDLILQKCEG